MKKKVVIPFTNSQNGGNKKTFKLLKDNEIKGNLMNFVKKMLYSNNNNNTNNTNKLNYIKASKTKNYYKNIKS